MGGPSTKRLNPASQPSLTGPGLDLLTSIFGGGGNRGNPSSPRMAGLRQQGGGMGLFKNNPLAEGGDVYARLRSVFGDALGPGFGQAQTGLEGLLNDNGQGLINAYQPTFQKNLGMAREQGARFSTGNQMLQSQALNDYNLFAAQTGEAARNRALQAAMGLGNLSLGQGEQQGQLLQLLLQALFKGGGINQDPVYQQSGGGAGNFIGGVVGTGLGALAGGIGAAAGGKIGSSLFG